MALRGGTDAVTHHESLFPINGLALVLIETGRADAALALLDDALSKADGRSDHNIVYGRMLGTYGYPQMKKRDRSEEHTSELQSLMRTSNAVFCLKKTNTTKPQPPTHHFLHTT